MELRFRLRRQVIRVGGPPLVSGERVNANLRLVEVLPDEIVNRLHVERIRGRHSPYATHRHSLNHGATPFRSCRQSMHIASNSPSLSLSPRMVPISSSTAQIV